MDGWKNIFCKRVRTAMRLTRNDILAMKQADHITMVSLFEKNKNNTAVITAFKEVNSAIKYWEIEVASSILVLDESLMEGKAECKFAIANSSLNWTWQTIAGMLLPNDECELLWLSDVETTLELVKYNLHADLLKLVVYRKEHRFHFNVGVTIAKNDERMIRGFVKFPSKELLTYDIE